MLDLKKLENELDEVLKNETTESLAKWLMKKRNRSYHIGIGEMDFVVQSTGEYKPLPAKNAKFNEPCKISSYDYSLAA